MSRRFTLAGLLFWLTFVALILAIVAPLYRWRSRRALAGLVIAVAVSDDASTIAALMGTGTVYVWDSDAAEPKAMFAARSGLLGRLALSPDGRGIAISGGIASERVLPNVQIWDVKTRQVEHQIKSQIGSDLAFSADGRWLAVCQKGLSRLTLFALADDQPPRAVRQLEKSRSAAFSPDGRAIAVLHADNSLRIYDLSTGTIQSTYASDGNGGKVQLAWSRNGAILIARHVPKRGKQKSLGLIESWSIPDGEKHSITTSVSLPNADFAFLPSRDVLVVPDGLDPMFLDAKTLRPIAQNPTGYTLTTNAAAGRKGGFFVLARASQVWVCSEKTFERQRLLLHPSPRPNLWPALIGLLIWWFVFSVRRSRKLRRACRTCGQQFQPVGKKDTNEECQACRLKAQVRLLTPAAAARQARRSNYNGMLTLCVIDAGAAAAIAAAERVRFGFWPVFVVLAISVPALLIGFLYARVRWKFWRARSPAVDVALADQASGTAGLTTEAGEMLIWSAEGTSLAPLLEAEFGLARQRLQAAIGHDPPAPTARAYFFADGEALARYVAGFGLRLNGSHALQSLYWRRSVSRLLVGERHLRERAADPRVTLRSFTIQSLLEDLNGKAPAAWIKLGLIAALAHDNQQHELARLERRMTAASAAGRTIAAEEMLGTTVKSLGRKLRGGELANFAWGNQFATQSWSVMEFLCGRGSTSDRRLAFQCFFNDADRRKRPAEAIVRHFGRSFDELLAMWQGSVEEQVTDEHHPPPEHVAKYLADGPIAKVASPETPPGERIAAIRELGEQGYLLGADALIGLLGSDSEEVREEAIWALECISGKVLGSSAVTWQRWHQTVYPCPAAPSVVKT